MAPRFGLELTDWIAFGLFIATDRTLQKDMVVELRYQFMGLPSC